MDTIRSYIENMFIGVQNTPDVERIKSELYGNMTDKYNELKNQGKSENEAIGVVISEFGNVDELLRELNVGRTEQNANQQNVVTYELAHDYIETAKRTRWYVAIGVALCILCPCLLLVLLGVSEEFGTISENNAALFGLIYLFAFVAVGVLVLILGGTKLERFEFLKKSQFVLSREAHGYLSSIRGGIESRSTITTAISVTLYILCAMPVIVCAFFDCDGGLAILVCVAVLLLIVAIATAVIIVGNQEKECLKVLWQQDDYAPSVKQESPLFSAISTLFWVIILALYLGWSFLRGDWGISWIIWPVAGAVYGVVTAVIKSVSTSGRDGSFSGNNNNGNYNNGGNNNNNNSGFDNNYDNRR